MSEERTLGDPALRPVEIDLDRTRELKIRWADGQFSRLPLTLLRQQCPCATCRDEREKAGKNPLRVLPAGARSADLATADSAELVGHYALRIFWRDGHQTGIYDYGLLRALGTAAAGEVRQPEPAATPPADRGAEPRAPGGVV